ncbi:hypothetical protein [Roseimicrobium sp. ORNL1]|uniref:hypothetical protein n=1 Tax=Roseimicrobium sp. ORNL1 TaxID=2711231 RepID=UPI0013E1D517|nr:hypothetical protein [Roseimicrobium sp. ORNL1]QIF04728.1 hypothetical protein G5S37_25410 [Roseimicrobium sp. ORNL1]
MHSKATLGYFCAPPGHFWTWHGEFRSAMGSVLGNFLGSRDTLVDLLEALAPDGLPPLGAVVLVNAAAQTVWDGVVIHTELQHACGVWKSGEPLPSTLASLWMHATRGLDAISNLPPELKNAAAKRTLVRMVFEGAFNRLPPDLSESILDEFKKTPDLEPFMQRAPDINGQARLLRDLSALAKAFDRLPPSQLEHRLRTGLDGDLGDQIELPLEDLKPEPPAIEIPDDLLAALEKEGGQLAQVAGVARRLSAVLHVPKPVSQQDDLPVGGVSDITNRGEPDRLLLTELAWDDLTFASRLAQGEALYSRRESPPSEPPPRRKILLDTGIHLWGKPRLFALGAVLALVRHLKRSGVAAGDQGGDVYTLADDQFAPVSLRTVEDVRTQLAKLEPAPFPSEALAHFVQNEMPQAEPGEEVFLVSHPDAMALLVREPSWQQLAATCLLHSIQVDRHGLLMLSRHSVAGSRTLSQAQVDLDALLQGPPERRPSLALTDEMARLPAFYHRLPWPLYYPMIAAGQVAFELPQTGHVGVTPDRCVCYWRTSARCGRVLWPYAPAPEAQRVMLVDGADPGTVALAFGTFTNCELLVCDVHGRRPSVLCAGDFGQAYVSGVSLQSGALVVYHSHGCDAFSAETGLLLVSYRGGVPRQRWFDGSSFREDARPVPLSDRLASTRMPRAHHVSRHTNITEVGFGPTNGLHFRKQSGMTYHLDVATDRTPCWRVCGRHADSDVVFRPLERLDTPQWPDVGLRQAEFADGRRVVYDPRGFMHMVDPRSNHELSVAVVKGNTAVWLKEGHHFGDRAYLWDEAMYAPLHLVAMSRRLCRPLLGGPSSVPPPPLPSCGSRDDISQAGTL